MSKKNISDHIKNVVEELSSYKEIQIQVVNSLFWGCDNYHLFDADGWYAPNITQRQCFLIFGKTYDSDFEEEIDEMSLISSQEAIDLLIYKVHQKVLTLLD